LEYALEHNIQLKESKVTQQSGLEDTRQAQAQLFPSLSASVSQDFVNYPSDNSDVARHNTYTGNYGLNASWTLFDANRRTNSIRSRKLQDQVNALGVAQSAKDIRVSLVQAYMQVLYASESVAINENTVEVDSVQVARAKQLYAAGSLSSVDVAQLESQLSTDKYQVVVARSTLDNYKLQLKQLLELDILDSIDVVMPVLGDSDVLAPLPPKEVIYNTSLAAMPEIKSGRLGVQIAALDTKIARAGYFPTLSLNAGIGSGNTSGLGSSFGNQIWDRLNESIGLTLAIPIYSNRSNKTAVNKARFAEVNSRLELQGAQKDLLKTVEGFYLDARSAQDQYTAAAEKCKYLNESYHLIEEQFDLGMKNTLDLLTEKNNLLTAQQQELQAKYMALMNIQLLNIYQGKPVDSKF
jgi:outer membrane protein